MKKIKDGELQIDRWNSVPMIQLEQSAVCGKQHGEEKQPTYRFVKIESKQVNTPSMIR